MSKILLFSDLHLRVNDSLGVIKDGENSRLEDKRKVLKKIVDIAIEQSVDMVVDLGDTFDAINPSDKLRMLYAEGLRPLIENKIKFARILGNHETDGKIGSGEDVSVWVDKESYHVVAKPTVINLNGLEILFIPEVNNDQVIKSLVEFPDHLCLGHFGVQGADYGSGKKDESGLLLKHFAKRTYPTYIGHYHKRQELLQGWIQYIGAICKANFGDADIPTGVTLLTFHGDRPSLTDEEVIEIEERQLHQFIFEEGFTEKQLVQKGMKIKNSIIKLRYYGSSDWYQLQDTKKTVKGLYSKGASKVFIEFNLTNNEIKELDLVDTNFNFQDLIEKQAKKDKQDAQMGLEYLRRSQD